MSWTSKKVPKSRITSDSARRSSKGSRGGKRKPQARGRVEIYGGAINQLRKDVGYVISVLNVEDKYIDTGATTTLSNAWQLFLLNGCSLGTTSITRNGQSVKLNSLEFRSFITIASASTTVQSSRMVIFVDKQSNAAAPTATDIYPATVASQRVVSYLDRFNILLDEWIILDPNTPSGEIVIKSIALNHHVSFNTSNNGDITDITKGSLYLAFLSDAGSNFPAVVWTNRVGFVDN
jgi:hypothetical protein